MNEKIMIKNIIIKAENNDGDIKKFMELNDNKEEGNWSNKRKLFHYDVYPLRGNLHQMEIIILLININILKRIKTCM